MFHILIITGIEQNQLKCVFDLYDQSIRWYDEFLQPENGRNCLIEVDQTLPEYVWMSEVKKTDFYL